MKLLIVTQKVNTNDPVLGFFHRWIEEFSKYFEKINVICLEKGEYNLPENVSVYSLGKEEGKSRIKYIYRFYKYIFNLRKDYDAVFIHMNQEYILLGGIFWKIMDKKTTMWRNHHAGSILTDLAMVMCDKIFCTSKFSYTAKSKKTVLMPVGIDDVIFRVDENINTIPHSILFIARISPSKRPHLLIEALGKIHKKNTEFTATFVGDALPADKNYLESLIKQVKDLGISEKVIFRPGVKNTDTVNFYNSHEICVNLSSSGMYDKTIFEAASCGCLSLTSNMNLIGELPDDLLFKENNTDDLVNKLENLMFLPTAEKKQLKKATKEYVFNKHSLVLLGKKLYMEMLT